MNSVTLPQPWAPLPSTDADEHGCAPAQCAMAGPVDAPARVMWRLHRRCALTPGQLGACGLALALVSLSIGLAFWAAGASAVLWFAGAETAALALALAVHALHATDGELLDLRGHVLHVEQRHGLRTRHRVLDGRQLRVAVTDMGIRLEGPAAAVLVGRRLRREAWSAMAAELRHMSASLRADSASAQ